MTMMTMMTVVMIMVGLSGLTGATGIGRKDPQGIHMAFGNTATSYIVVWLTLDEMPSSVIQFGSSAGNLTQSASGSSRTYDHVGAGYNHVVEFDVDGVVGPGETLFYTVGSPGNKVSEVLSMVVTRGESADKPWGFAAFGDLGLKNGRMTMGRLNQHASEWDLIVHAGDISYANDEPWTYETVWQEWFLDLQDTTVGTPYMVAPGNHEAWCRNPICAVQTANFSTYLYKYEMPSAACGSNTNMFYSFDHKNVHFVAISTETDYPGRPIDLMEYAAGAYDEHDHFFQLNWLKEDLAKAHANRDNVPWIVVFGHRPVYTSGSSDVAGNDTVVNTAEKLREWLEPMFDAFQVDLYFSGHQHDYHRMYPVLDEKLVGGKSYDPAMATTYVVSGAAGNAEGHDHPDPPAIWQAVDNYADYGYSTIQIVNASVAVVEFRLSQDDTVFDSFTLVRPRS